MKKSFKLYDLFAVIGTLVLSVYPLFMGGTVMLDMLRYGAVDAANYPKYIIPYTPISLAVLMGVLLMPLVLRYLKRFALAVASAVSLGVFFAAELLLENLVIVSETTRTTLESWQMYMCYIPPQMIETRTWRAVDVLIGEYSPMFKFHFYAIAIVLVLGILGCVYGFAQMLRTGERGRQKALILQSVSTALFLGLCIFACFTAFFRDGEITVSPLSAVLMGLFFVVFGVTVGLYTGSFLLTKGWRLSVVLPAIVASVVTSLMYIGELYLLSGHLYRFGTGFFFEGLGGIVLAPIDLVIILLSGGICGLILHWIRRPKLQE